MAADKDIMASLHEEVALQLLSRIQAGEATPAELSVAVKFLKDNGIDASIDKNEPLSNLAKTLPFTIESEVA
jgi:hypothetical protein